jgi:dTDP-4-dehydrorhamnose reductase
MSIRVLVFGRSGQVARELARVARPDGVTVHLCGRDSADITDAGAVARQVERVAPDVVVNAAAYTAVDAAEDDAERAFAVNADGAANIAKAAQAAGAALVQLSTDYVFDGTKLAPYREDDPVAPLGVYGRSKAAGERAVQAHATDPVILRTAWVYSPFGQNFVRTMLNAGASRPRLTVVDDQVGNPTAAGDIAAAVLRVVETLRARSPAALAGTYHLAGEGDVSWCGFAREIFRQAGAHGYAPVPEVQAIPSRDWPTRAPRPSDSRLDCARFAQTFAWTPPAWPTSLASILAELLAPSADAGHDRP